MLHPTKYADDHIVMLLWQHAWFLPLQNEILPFATQQSKYLVLSKTYGSPTFHWVSSLTFLYLLPRVATNGIIIHQTHYEKSDWSRAFNQFTIACELDMINAISAECNICCRYCIYHVKFNVCLVTKPLGVFSSETKWLNSSLLFLRMNYVKNV